MRFEPLGPSDARLIRPALHGDERGSFMRTWCARAFREAGIDFTPVQGNVSVTRMRGTVRGMHFQRAPQPDAKVVRCSAGRIYDVVVDLRLDSPLFGESFATELSAEGTLLFVPAGFAHGFQTLTDDVTVEYLMGTEYRPDLADGFRYDDPSLPVRWPEPVTVVSEADRTWSDLAERLPQLRERPRHGHA